MAQLLVNISKLWAELHQKQLDCKACLAEILGETDHNVIVLSDIDDFFKSIYGQQHAPLFPHVSIYQYAPCGMHAHANISGANFRHMSEVISGVPDFFDAFAKELRTLNLQYLHAFVESELTAEQMSKKLKKLHLIGRDCIALEKNMGSILRKMQTSFESQYDHNNVHAFFDPLIEIWYKWAAVAPYLRMKMVSSEDLVQDCKEKALDFVTSFAHIAVDENVTYYMHFLQAHLWQWMAVYSTELGFGYGILTTQSMEHRLKLVKRDLRHTLRTEAMWGLAMKHHHQRLWGGLELTETARRNFTCGRCGASGHQRNNKCCPLK